MYLPNSLLIFVFGWDAEQICLQRYEKKNTQGGGYSKKLIPTAWELLLID